MREVIREAHSDARGCCRRLFSDRRQDGDCDQWVYGKQEKEEVVVSKEGNNDRAGLFEPELRESGNGLGGWGEKKKL